MTEIRVLRNDVDEAGTRRVRAMSQGRIDRDRLALQGIVVPEEAAVKVEQDEIRLYHLEAEWPPRGELVEFRADYSCDERCPLCRGAGCAWRRLTSLWRLRKGERISQAVEEAAVAYALQTGQDPLFAWVRTLPGGTEYGTPVRVGGGEVLVFEASWMPRASVAVGRGN